MTSTPYKEIIKLKPLLIKYQTNKLSKYNKLTNITNFQNTNKLTNIEKMCDLYGYTFFY